MPAFVQFPKPITTSGQRRKKIHQCYILSLCVFFFHTQHLAALTSLSEFLHDNKHICDAFNCTCGGAAQNSWCLWTSRTDSSNHFVFWCYWQKALCYLKVCGKQHLQRNQAICNGKSSFQKPQRFRNAHEMGPYQHKMFNCPVSQIALWMCLRHFPEKRTIMVVDSLQRDYKVTLRKPHSLSFVLSPFTKAGFLSLHKIIVSHSAFLPL